MRVKRLLEELQNVDPEALVVVEYPPHRCKSEHGRLPGIANVDEVFLIDALHRAGGGFITSETPEEEISTEEEVRLRIVQDVYP